MPISSGAGSYRVSDLKRRGRSQEKERDDPQADAAWRLALLAQHTTSGPQLALRPAFTRGSCCQLLLYFSAR
jgi:hypothetical protein